MALIATVLLLSTAASAARAPADAVGTWKWSLPSVDGRPVEVILTIENQAGALRGTYTETGQGSVPVEVSLNGDTLSFTVEPSAIGEAKYIGRLEDDTVDGLIHVTRPPGETAEPLAWTAKKALIPETPLRE